MRPSVRPSICPSQAGIVPEWLNAGSCKQCHTLEDFSDANDLGEIPMALPSAGVPNGGGVGSNRQFSTNISLCLNNGASYCGMLIGTRMCCIDLCYFSDIG